MKTKSFGVKLWMYFALFTAVIFCILWLLQTVFLQSFYNKMEIKNINNCAERIIKEQNNEDITESLDDIAHKNALLVFLTDTDGNVIYSADEHNFKKGNRQKIQQNEIPFKNNTEQFEGKKRAFRSLPEDYENFLLKLSESDDKIVSYENGSLYIYGTVLDNGNVLYISKPLDSIEGTINILFRQLIWVTLASLAFGFILSYFVSRRFSKPIKAITEQALNINNEDYQSNFEKGFCRETDELSEIIEKTSADLIKAENYRREFFANISHDLRTPLTMIKGYAEMVKDFSWQEKDSRESDLDVIIKESDRLTSLVNEILEYGSFQSNAKKYDIKKCNISEIANSVIKQFASLSKKNGIVINTNIENDLYVLCDIQEISRVLYNFIDNALNHTKNEITVSVNRKDDQVLVKVRDFGDGIDEESLEHIWDRYFTKKQSKRAKTGSGLGLAISKEILSAHDAQYGVESKMGEGTVFWFSLLSH